jgi:hypothetical protein
MGADFLLTNAVSDIPMTVMRAIKKEAFDKYLPHDRRPIKAWGLAMASLRCLKRDLVKNKNKQIAAAAAATPLDSNSLKENNAFNENNTSNNNNNSNNNDDRNIILSIEKTNNSITTNPILKVISSTTQSTENNNDTCEAIINNTNNNNNNKKLNNLATSINTVNSQRQRAGINIKVASSLQTRTRAAISKLEIK